jgi:hypothetical protein
VVYVFEEAEDRPLKAIYFDNEGHVIYEFKDSVMWGKFRMRMPGQADWKSYLEWNGAKR